jgi:hypothetical protein
MSIPKMIRLEIPFLGPISTPKLDGGNEKDVQINLQEEPNSNFTTLDDSMVNTAAASLGMEIQCDLSNKSLHELLESAINETFGTVGMQS